jgi:hypothetical protein
MAIAYRMYRWETSLKKIFWPALFFKMLCGLLLGLLYKYYYPVGDTFAYFSDAAALGSVARSDLKTYLGFFFFNHELPSVNLIFLEPRALFFSKIVSVFSILTADNYWVIASYFSLFSFLAAWLLVKTIAQYLPRYALPSIIAFLFVPSVVFWTSGLIKESIAIGGLYLLTVFFLRVWFDRRIRLAELFMVAILVWICWSLKYYVIAIFLPVVLASLLMKFIVLRKPWHSAAFETTAWMVVFILPLFLITFLHPNFYPERFLEVIVSNNTAYNELSQPGDAVHFTDLQADTGSIIRNAPWALFSGLFRPLFWEATNVLQFFSGLENTLLLLFFLIGLFQLKAYVHSPNRVLVLTVIVYVALLCIFITLSAPNFGTLSRYRGAYLSFFVFLLLCCHPILAYLQRSLDGLLVNKSKSTFAD